MADRDAPCRRSGADRARASRIAARLGALMRWLVPVLALAAVPARAAAHPLHTTFTDVRHDGASRTLQLTIRVFADDFRAAAARFAGLSPQAARALPDSAMARYARARVRLQDAGGRALAVRWEGVRAEGEVLAITLRVSGVHGMAGVRLGNALMLETFSDQVNIVRAAGGGRRGSMLFTARDAASLKALPG